MKTCNVICNPHGGKGISKENIEKIRKTLEDYHYNCIFNFTEYPKHAIKIVKELQDCDLLISIGGDGTFSEVVTGNIMRKKSILMSHLPNGTTNDVSFNFGLNKNIIENLKSILDGKVTEIDVPTLNDKPFIYVAGCGKFLDIPYITPQELKKKIGRMAYIVEGAKDFFRKPKSYHVNIEVDGQKYSGEYSIIIISNSTSIAGFKNFYKNVDLTDGKVELVMLYSKSRRELLNAMIQMATLGASGVTNSFKCSAQKISLEFIGDVPKNWDVDGEDLDSKEKKYLIEVIHTINLLIPRRG